MTPSITRVKPPAPLLLSDRHARLSPMSSLMDNASIRRENLRALHQKHGTRVVLDKLGIGKQALSQYIGKNFNRNVGNEVARRIEEAFNLPAGWMDYPQYETEEILQRIVNYARSLTPDEQKILLQLIQLTGKFRSTPPEDQ
jgi:transcriptional regulator with XRE-family HTH domain